MFRKPPVVSLVKSNESSMALFHLLVGREGEGLRVAAQGLDHGRTVIEGPGDILGMNFGLSLYVCIHVYKYVLLLLLITIKLLSYCISIYIYTHAITRTFFSVYIYILYHTWYLIGICCSWVSWRCAAQKAPGVAPPEALQRARGG